MLEDQGVKKMHVTFSTEEVVGRTRRPESSKVTVVGACHGSRKNRDDACCFVKEMAHNLNL